MKLKNIFYFIKYKLNIVINPFIKLFSFFYLFFLKIRVILLISLIIILLYKLIPLILYNKIIIYNSNINFILHFCGLNHYIFSEIFKFIIFIILIFIIYYIFIKILKYFNKLHILINCIYIIGIKYISYFIYYIYTDSDKSFIGFFLLDPEGKKKILLDVLEKRNLKLTESDFNKIIEFINSLKDINEVDLIEAINKLLDLLKSDNVENTTTNLLFWGVITGIIIVICIGGYIISNYEIFKPETAPSNGVWGGPIVDGIRDRFIKPTSSILDNSNVINNDDPNISNIDVDSLKPVKIVKLDVDNVHNDSTLIPKQSNPIITLKDQDIIQVDVNVVVPPNKWDSTTLDTMPIPPAMVIDNSARSIADSPYYSDVWPLQQYANVWPLNPNPNPNANANANPVQQVNDDTIIRSPARPELDDEIPNLINTGSVKLDIYPNSLRLFIIICIFLKNTYKYFKKK